LSESPIIKHTIREIIEALGDSLQSGDLHVYISHDKFEDIPFTYPFRIDNYGILIVRKGSLNILLNLISFTITKNEIIALTPQTVFHLQEYSEDLEVVALSFSTDFIFKNTYFDADFRPSYTNKLRGSVKLGLSLKYSKNSNQFLYIQYYGGHSEDLINYNESVSNLRIGIVFKDLFPNFKN
jgi:hypothetical protein